jgi:hypothetical protein
MSAKKPPENKAENPLENVKVNISMTRGTSDILKKLADHLHVSSSAAVTCLIRRKAEEVGLLSPIVSNVIPPITVVPPSPKKATGTK